LVQIQLAQPFLFFSFFFEPLAQSVEHLTFNQRVEGSSPSWLTKFFVNTKQPSFFVIANLFQYAGVAELADAPDLGSGAARRGGSTPFTRTNYDF
jgi:hypothetical protein